MLIIFLFLKVVTVSEKTIPDWNKASEVLYLSFVSLSNMRIAPFSVCSPYYRSHNLIRKSKSQSISKWNDVLSLHRRSTHLISATISNSIMWKLCSFSSSFCSSRISLLDWNFNKFDLWCIWLQLLDKAVLCGWPWLLHSILSLQQIYQHRHCFLLSNVTVFASEGTLK